MESRGTIRARGRGGRRGGRRGGYSAPSRGGRGFRGRGGPRPRIATADTPVEKQLPKFVKIHDIRPGRNFDIVVKVENIKRDTTRQEKRGGKLITTTCTEALVGDETGCIAFSTRNQEKVESLVEGGTYVLLNAKMRRITGERSWLDVDRWGAVKPVSESVDLLPPGFNTSFEIDKSKDRTLRVVPKPSFITVTEIEPESKNLHLLLKVVSVKVEERVRSDGRPTKVAEAVVGDQSGRLTLVARAQNSELLKEGAVVAIFNSHVEMYKGYMRLIADRWSDIKLISQMDASLLPAEHVTESTTVGVEDRSAQEWVLEQ